VHCDKGPEELVPSLKAGQGPQQW